MAPSPTSRIFVGERVALHFAFRSNRPLEGHAMPISMYQVSVPRFIHTLESLRSILDRAIAYEADKKLDPSVLPNARLFPDMLPLTLAGADRVRLRQGSRAASRAWPFPPSRTTRRRSPN